MIGVADSSEVHLASIFRVDCCGWVNLVQLARKGHFSSGFYKYKHVYTNNTYAAYFEPEGRGTVRLRRVANSDKIYTQ
jgi:hypothetical protein